jgi:hypothetical protein
LEREVGRLQSYQEQLSLKEKESEADRAEISSLREKIKALVAERNQSL